MTQNPQGSIDVGLLERLSDRMQREAQLRDAISLLAETYRHLQNVDQMCMNAIGRADAEEHARLRDVHAYAVGKLQTAVSWVLIVAGETDTAGGPTP